MDNFNLRKYISEGRIFKEALSYAFSEYDFIIKDDAYKAEVEAKIKKELKKVQSKPLEIPEKDLQAIIKNAENYFAKEARKEEKANRNPRKIKSTEFAQFAADYYTEEFYPDEYGKDYPDKRGNMQAIQTGYTPEQAERFRRSDVVPFLIDYGVKGNDGKTIGLYNMPDDYYTMDAKEFDKKYEVYQRREIKRRNDRLKDPDFPIEKLQDKPGGPLKLQKDFYEIRAWEFDKIYGKGGEIEDDDFDLEDYLRLGFLKKAINEAFDELDDGYDQEIEDLIKSGPRLNKDRFEDVIYYIHNNWMAGNYGDDYAIRRISKYLNALEENVAPNHDGKAAPYGSGYKAVKETLRFIKENNPEFTNEEIKAELKEIKELGNQLNEKLCPKGEAYRKRRMAAGEKSSAYLSGRAVKVCKGQMSGKKKKKKK